MFFDFKQLSRWLGTLRSRYATQPFGSGRRCYAFAWLNQRIQNYRSGERIRYDSWYYFLDSDIAITVVRQFESRNFILTRFAAVEIIVMPAQAGIHQAILWISAFAEMTGWDRLITPLSQTDALLLLPIP